ncbi:MAG TPA: cyclopropane-fatty-acyl-phospholipid synthase family protein [Polyangiaceae bacterium]|nr:cyclopropane-fatty-acyl-phospholipid synthase family protein [Polyangiaceae bacterium]
MTAHDFVPFTAGAERARSPGAWSFRRVVEQRLAALAHGTLELRASGATSRFGTARPGELAARVDVRDARFFKRVALGGTLGAAESYVDGDWSTDDLVGLVRLLLRNERVTDGLESGPARLGALVARGFGALRRNTRAGSRRNIAEHYDLGNDFFERMLDPTLSYSSAVFPTSDATLEAASLHKLELVCDRLGLRPGEHVLEIGTGWGGFALFAARRGARVTTTTLSREQARAAADRFARAGLADRITLLEQDYRELEGRFDHLVSIEMIEAVGPEYYDTFFAKCDALLAPGGRFVLQSITIPERLYDRHVREVDFIKRHVFPGSSLPSVSALLGAAARRSELDLVELADYGAHYARTLAAWRQNLAPHRGFVRERFGQRFERLWDFYLAYCEAGFAERYIGVAQLVFERKGRRQP